MAYRSTTTLLFGALVLFATGSAEAATPTYYNSLASFQIDVTDTVTDDYSNPGYMFIQGDAQMSGIVGETDYMSTGFMNLNHRERRLLLRRLQWLVRAVVPDDEHG